MRRPRGALPLRGLRGSSAAMFRPSARGMLPRGAGHLARGVGQFARPRGQRGGRLLPAASRGQPQGLKRKAPDADGSAMPDTKRPAVAEEDWETQPIIHQPLGATEDEWYQDTWS